jgi:Zn-dependent protease
MKGASNLSRLLGVRIRLDYSWAVALVLITAVVVTQFPEAYPLWQRIALGLVASLLFFVAVGIREFALNLMALRRDIPVRRITLFIFGGAPQVAKEDTLPVLELLMALTGLLSNLLIAGIFYGAHLILVTAGSVVFAGLIQWLAFICFTLALFHFVPAFPLDGGRALRVVIWKATGNYDRATRIASLTGRGIGLLCITGGILELILAQQWFFGLLLVFVGWVLQNAAAQSQRQAVPYEMLRGTMARDMMTGGYPLIPQQLSLGQLIRDYILVTGQCYFLVVDGVKLRGIVTMRNIKRIPKGHRDSTPVGEIMIPLSELKVAHPRQPAASLLEQMDELGVNQMPVLENGALIGIVSRERLLRLVRARAKLGA